MLTRAPTRPRLVMGTLRKCRCLNMGPSSGGMRVRAAAWTSLLLTPWGPTSRSGKLVHLPQVKTNLPCRSPGSVAEQQLLGHGVHVWNLNAPGCDPSFGFQRQPMSTVLRTASATTCWWQTQLSFTLGVNSVITYVRRVSTPQVMALKELPLDRAG